MKCFLCNGEMEMGTAPFHVDRNGYHITFDKIPAWICKQCGEPYFEEIQVNEIQNAIKDMDKHANQLNRAA
jgi:YgiT-type zinc finger domain-containing protein